MSKRYYCDLCLDETPVRYDWMDLEGKLFELCFDCFRTLINIKPIVTADKKGLIN